MIAYWIDRYWFSRWHWTHERAPNQFQFYRCRGCHRIVTWKHVKRDGGCACGAARISPTMPRGVEKLQLLFFPWTI